MERLDFWLFLQKTLNLWTSCIIAIHVKRCIFILPLQTAWLPPASNLLCAGREPDGLERVFSSSSELTKEKKAGLISVDLQLLMAPVHTSLPQDLIRFSSYGESVGRADASISWHSSICAGSPEPNAVWRLEGTRLWARKGGLWRVSSWVWKDHITGCSLHSLQDIARLGCSAWHF